MSKMTRAWVEAQIEHELERGNHPDAVRDLAALIEVRKYMMEHDLHHEPQTAEIYHDKNVVHDPMLDTVPTMDQIEKAMGTIAVNSEADKKRMQDAMTWAKILKGEG